MKYFMYTLAVIFSALLTSCDAHKYEEDYVGIQQTQILCTDGKIYTFEQSEQLSKEPIAVVFHSSQNEEIDGYGYAVYLWDLPPAQFADSLNVKQKTSADVTAFDGNLNTYQMLDSRVVHSPIAENVFSIWKYFQSAYIPSVAEMRLLYEAASKINPYIIKCGGDPIPTEADNCWYWTSTEVKGQETLKAWLYSTCSGAFQETRKDAYHKVRPIVSLRY